MRLAEPRVQHIVPPCGRSYQAECRAAVAVLHIRN
jgi:hypothetical protein